MSFRILATLAALLAAVPSARAQLALGEKVPNLCWYDGTEKEVCLYDWNDPAYVEGVKLTRVLLYGAGHCEPCRQLVANVVNGGARFTSRKVVFINVLSEGWKGGDLPGPSFLKDYAKKNGFSLPIVGSPEDPGRVFFGNAGLPGVAIVQKDNTLGYSAGSVSAEDIFTALDALLAE